MASIYFDLDGTLASLYSVEGWLPDLKAGKTRPYAEAAPMVDPVKLSSLLDRLAAKGYKLGVISWSAKGATNEYSRRIRKTKKEWLKKNAPQLLDNFHVIKYGTPKHWRREENSILVDDEKDNRDNWTKGRTIDATNTAQMLEELEALAA